MALATELPIYREAYNLLLLATQLTRNFSRDYRYGLARDIRIEAKDVVKYIFKANSSRDKTEILEQLRESLMTLQLDFRLSKDLRLISPKQFGSTVVLTQAVGKQLTGWLNYTRKSA